MAISSSLNHEFLAAAASNPVPGYLPNDSRDVHRALRAVATDLETCYPGRFTGNVLLGLSLGGMQALWLAAHEPRGEFELDLFVAINAPIDLHHAIRTLDDFYNAPLQYPDGQQNGRIRRILRKALDVVQRESEPGDPLGFTAQEAEFLIGLAFRTVIRDVIYQAQRDHDFGVLQTEGGSWTRTAPYREILQFSFMEYLYAFILPYYAERMASIEFDQAGAQSLLSHCNLRTVSTKLTENPKVLYFGNKNDFLLAPEDVSWLETAWGPNRVFLFERGGHLGNLHREDVQRVIASVIERAIAREADTSSNANEAPE